MCLELSRGGPCLWAGDCYRATWITRCTPLAAGCVQFFPYATRYADGDIPNLVESKR